MHSPAAAAVLTDDIAAQLITTVVAREALSVTHAVRIAPCRMMHAHAVQVTVVASATVCQLTAVASVRRYTVTAIFGEERVGDVTDTIDAGATVLTCPGIQGQKK